MVQTHRQLRAVPLESDPLVFPSPAAEPDPVQVRLADRNEIAQARVIAQELRNLGVSERHVHTLLAIAATEGGPSYFGLPVEEFRTRAEALLEDRTPGEDGRVRLGRKLPVRPLTHDEREGNGLDLESFGLRGS